MFSATLANIIGAIILIAIILPWFLIAVAAILLGYVYFAAFYRASAREIKVCDTMSPSRTLTNSFLCVETWCQFSSRFLEAITEIYPDAILRSALYTHFSESLSGLATVSPVLLP
jgi:hypothetical protein